MFKFLKPLATLSMLAAVAGGIAGCETHDSEEQDKASVTRAPAYEVGRVAHYGYGSPASPTEIAGWDIDIRADGVGLPEGSGSVEDGEWLYEEQCAECHGSFGEGVGRFPILAGGEGTLRDARPTKTVGSYWPHTSTLYDYIRRSMPFTRPASLSDDETYALTAYVLYLNDLVGDDFVLTGENLPGVQLPNVESFVPDPRPDVTNVRCMENCRDPATIEVLSEVAQVPVDVETLADTELADVHPGKETYDQFCHICHAVGVGGAPKIGDGTEWEDRIGNGFESMLANAINGMNSETGVMPPKGGFAQLSDGEVSVAVEYMVEASE